MRVAVFGAGYAGLTLARKLEARLPPAVELVVVNDEPTHLLLHEVHRAIRRPDVADVIRVPLEDVLDRATVRVARVASVDPEAGVATLASGGTVEYDYGAVCLGSAAAFHDIPGVETHGTPLKSLADAARIREGFLPLCADGGRVVVGGAGLSGVQVAGEFAALARERNARDRVRVTLLERLPEVAPGFPANFRAAVREELTARDVEIRTEEPIRGADHGELRLAGDRRLSYDQFVWTGGITGTPAMGGERPPVRGDLRLTDSTFVVGDAARAVDADGEAVPASASAAVREAGTVADNLARLVDHDLSGTDAFAPRLEPYRFDVPGWVVSVGDGAVAQVGPTVLTGSAARTVKAGVGAGYLGSVRAVRNAIELVEEEVGASADPASARES